MSNWFDSRWVSRFDADLSFIVFLCVFLEQFPERTFRYVCVYMERSTPTRWCFSQILTDSILPFVEIANPLLQCF